MQSLPLVSVLMPVRNGGPFLDPAIASIRCQSLADWELLVCDDGSDDGSGGRLASWSAADPRIRVIPLPGPVGIANALNILSDHARGGLLARMDADDLCAPDRLCRQVDFLHAHPDHVAVSVGALCVDPDGRPIAPLPQCEDPGDLLANLLNHEGPGICHPATMFRRDAFFQAGRYRDKFRYVEDVDLWLRMLPLGKFGVIPETLFRYRQHIHSVCHQRSAEQQRLRALMTEEAIRDRRQAGLPVPPPRPGRFMTASLYCGESSPDGLFRNWAFNAALAGYRRTAVHWAFRVWRHDILNRANWWLLIEAVAGPRAGGFFKKCYAAQKRLWSSPAKNA